MASKEITKAQWQTFFRRLALDGDITAACGAGKFTRQSYYYHRANDSEFKAEVELILANVKVEVATAAEDNIEQAIMQGDVKASMFFLKHSPQTKRRWAARSELTGPEGSPIETNSRVFIDASTVDLERLIDAYSTSPALPIPSDARANNGEG